MKIDATTLYYLFSTAAQTHGAIVGFIGMLTVHRLQQLESFPMKAVASVERILLAHQSEFGPSKQPDYVAYKWSRVKKARPGLVPTEDGEELDRVMSSIEKSKRVQDGTKDRFIIFLITNLLVILLSVCLIPFSEALKDPGLCGYSVMGLLACLVFMSIGATLYLGFIFVETTWKDFWQRTKVNIVEHGNRYWNWFKSIPRRIFGKENGKQNGGE